MILLVVSSLFLVGCEKHIPIPYMVGCEEFQEIVFKDIEFALEGEGMYLDFDRYEGTLL